MAIMTNKDFLRIYRNLPKGEKGMPICVLDEEPYSWNVVNIEVKGNTKMSKRMLRYISQILRWTKADKNRGRNE